MMKRSAIGGQGASPVLLALVCVTGILLASDAGAVTLSVSSASGGPGDTVEICVDMATGGDEVAGVQADMVWNPACAEINVGSCRAGDHDKPLHKSQRSKSRLRAILLALDNVDPIPDGSRLFCCDFLLLENADAGDCRVSLQNVSSSDSVGNAATTSSYAGAILPRGGLSTSGGSAGSAGSEPVTAPIEEKAVSGGAGSQAPVVAVGSEPADDSVQVAEAPVKPAAIAAAPPVDEVRSAMAPPAEKLEVEEARPAAVEAPPEPAVEDAAVAEKVTEAPAVATPKKTEEAKDGSPKATLTVARATATAVVAPTGTKPAKARAASEPKSKDESACQIASGSSGSGAVLLLIAGIALVGLRRRVWK